MGRNLTNLYISQSFQFLTQVSGSELQDGLGNTISGSLNITASLANTALTANTASYVLNAVSSSFATSASQATNANTAISSSFSTTATSASYALTSTSSSVAINATSASYATNALSSSYALTASYALNAGGATVNTGSLLLTASAAANVITFTKGDGSTFPVTVATGSAVSASFATTASLALNNVLTASVNSNTITFTKGDGTTFPITVNTGSAVTVNTGSLLVTASISNATTTFTKGDGSTFSLTANNVVNATSASVATSASFATTASYVASVVSASYALSASQAATATTASFASTIANGLSPTFANATASNVLITGTASIAFLNTTTISSSVIFTSGSNQLGDSPTLDTQSLYGKVIVTGSFASTGSAGFTGGDFKVTDQTRNGEFDVDKVIIKTQTGTQFTGSVSSQNGFTGSLQGTASFANNATSASFATTASYALNANINTGSLLLTASATNNVITFTKGDGSTFPVTVNTGSGAAAFPYTGSAQITGSLAVTGSIVTNAPNVTLGTAYQDTVALGRNAGKDLTGEGYNVLIGADRFGGNEGAGSNITSGQENTVIGSSAGVNMTDGSQNTIIGSLSHFGINGSQNTMVGYANAQFGSNGATGNVSMGRWAGYEQHGSYNVLLGWRTGFTSNGNYNIFLGPDVQGQGAPSFTGSNFLALGSSQVPSNNLLYGYHGESAQRFLNVKGNLNTSGSGDFVGKLTISQSQNDFTAGAFELYSVRNEQPLIIMYEYGGQAYIKAPRGNGLMFIEGGGGANDFIAINNASAQIFPYKILLNTPTTISSSLTLTGSLDVTGSVSGNVLGNNTDSYTSSPRVQQVVTLTQTEYNAIGTPDANTLYIISGSAALNTASFATTGSNTFVGNQTVSGSLTVTGSATFRNNTVFSGSIRGEVNTLTITSNTASMNCALDNFFTLTLVSGSTTHLSASNIQPGQTINLLVNTTGSGLLTFASSFRQISGSAYTATTGSAPGKDILTFISFDSSNLYTSNVKNLV